MEDKQTSSRNKRRERKLTLLYVLGGGILTEDFITKHMRIILFVFFLIIFFIANRYNCMQKLKEIDHLQQQARDLRYEAISTSSELPTNSRESQVEELVKEQGLNMEGAKEPPYELYK